MELINLDEAAEILGVGKHQVLYHIKKGILRAKLIGQAKYVRADEVHQLKEITASNSSLQEIAARAARAEMAACRLERVVTQLLSVIGADNPSADVSREAVAALHYKAEDELKQRGLPSVDTVMFWAQTFQSLSEQYFFAVSAEFDTGEPWAIYLELSNKFIRDMPTAKTRNDLELHTAYNFLELARRGMRQTIFMYAAMAYSKKLAYRLVPEAAGDVHEGVLAMASAMFD